MDADQDVAAVANVAHDQGHMLDAVPRAPVAVRAEQAVLGGQAGHRGALHRRLPGPPEADQVADEDHVQAVGGPKF